MNPTVYLIGIDEVGRGAIAGPVVVGAVLMPIDAKIPLAAMGVKLKDSKKLNEIERKSWSEWMKKQMTDEIFIAVQARVYPKAIDAKNISQAANQAALKVFQKLIQCIIKNTGNAVEEIRVYLDGGLYLKNKQYQQMLDVIKNPASIFLSNQFRESGQMMRFKIKTVIKGDEKIKIIKLASIFAKVCRDRYMIKQSRYYPIYNLEKNKGYGTDKHLKVIKKYGPKNIHRLTFIGKNHKIKNA